MANAIAAPEVVPPASTADSAGDLFDLPPFPPAPTRPDPLPRLAVVMPLYNACTPSALVLHTALSSILSQSHAAFSFVVVDDASTDSTAALLGRAAAHDGRVRVLRNASQRGVAHSLMRAIRSLDPSVEFVARMDGDDVSQPDRLHQQLQHMRRHPDLHVLGSAVHILSDASSTSRSISHPLSAAMVDWSMSFYCSLAHPSVLIRRSVFDTCSYPLSPSLAASSPCEDYHLWLRLLRSSHRLSNLPQPLLALRRHSGRVSAARHVEQSREALRLATQHVRAVTQRRVPARAVQRVRQPSTSECREEASEAVGLLLALERAWQRRWLEGGGQASDGEWTEVRADATRRIGELVVLAMQLSSRAASVEKEGEHEAGDDTDGLCEDCGDAAEANWRHYPAVPAISSDPSTLMSLWLARGGQSASLLSALLTCTSGGTG